MKLNLKKLLIENNIFMNLQARTKGALIEEMIDGLHQAGYFDDRDTVLEAILAREKKMSTGMKNGIAIPHGKTDSVDKLIVALGRKEKGLDFTSLDGQPSDIFIMTIAPSVAVGPHLQFLAEVSYLLENRESRDRVRKARTWQDINAIFTKQ